MASGAHFYHTLIDSGAVEELFDEIEMAMNSGIVQWSEPVPEGRCYYLACTPPQRASPGGSRRDTLKPLMQDKWSTWVPRPIARAGSRTLLSPTDGRSVESAAACRAVVKKNLVRQI